MRFRKLRIAWSVVWGVVAVLLLVLWIRSYWWVEILRLPATRHHVIECNLIPGQVLVGVIDEARLWYPGGCLSTVDFKDIIGSYSVITSRRPTYEELLQLKFPGYISLPDWPIVIPTGVLALVPWLFFRFTLRTLLLAITAVGVLLGLIVWSIR